MVATSIPIYLAITLAIGFWASRRIKTANDFTLAGRNLSTTLVGVTIFATWFGPEYIMGVPGLFVERGILGTITDQFGVLLCLVLVGSFYARKLYRMNIVTLSDFFRMRYNKSIELCTSLIQVFTYFFWIAAQFVALAYLFQAVLNTTIPQGILLGATIVVIYTYIGGMWAVSFTDLLQSIIIVIGLLVVLGGVLDRSGGLGDLLSSQREGFYNFFPSGDLYSWTSYLAAWMAFGIGVIPAQEIYQRLFSAKSARSGVRGIFLAAILLFVISAIPLIIGLAAAKLNPELMGGDHGQSLIPAMVSQYASLPVQMLFFGALISAILSTSSGAMLSPATIIGENLLRPYLPGMTDQRLLLWTRISVVLVAAISCVFAFRDSDIHGLVVESAVLLMVCLFAPLTFGLFWKKANVRGAWAAIIAGGVVYYLTVYLETRIDPTIYGTFASCLAMIIGSQMRITKDELVG